MRESDRKVPKELNETDELLEEHQANDLTSTAPQ